MQAYPFHRILPRYRLNIISVHVFQIEVPVHVCVQVVKSITVQLPFMSSVSTVSHSYLTLYRHDCLSYIFLRLRGVGQCIIHT